LHHGRELVDGYRFHEESPNAHFFGLCLTDSLTEAGTQQDGKVGPNTQDFIYQGHAGEIRQRPVGEEVIEPLRIGLA